MVKIFQNTIVILKILCYNPIREIGIMRKEGELKSRNCYRMSFFRKLGITVASVAIFAGGLFGFVGCGDKQVDKPEPDRPGIIVPDDPNKEDPGKEEPGKDEPGKDEPGKEEPGTDDPGKEEPGTDEPGTDEPGKDEPGTDEPGKDEPGIDNPNKDPEDNPKPVDPPEPEIPDTMDELFAVGNEEYVDIVSDTLNDNLYEKIVNKTFSNNMGNIKDARWEIVSKDGVNIDMIRIFAFNDYSETVMTYNIANVVPKTTITIADLVKPDTKKLEKAFDTTVRGGAKYTREYVFSFNPSIQEKRKELKDAVNTKLANDGVIERVTQDTQSFIVDGGSAVDTAFGGTSRAITILNINGNGHNEYTVIIKETQGNNNDRTLTDNLKKNLYRVVANEEKEYQKSSFDNIDLEEGLASVRAVYTNPENNEIEIIEL